MAEYYSTVCVHQTLPVHSSIQSLRFFLAIVNSAAVNIGYFYFYELMFFFFFFFFFLENTQKWNSWIVRHSLGF